MDIDFDVEEESIVRTIEKLKRRVNDGAEDGLDKVLNVGQETVREEILTKRRPYTTPYLYSSFRTHQVPVGDVTKGFITSPLEHAAYVDQGVSGTKKKRNTPFSYSDKMPPLEEMIEYVNERMGGWDWDSGAGGDPEDRDPPDYDGDGIIDEDPKKDSEHESEAKYYKTYDHLVKEDTGEVHQIIEERDDGYVLDSDSDRRFYTYSETSKLFDHSLLDGNNIDTPDYRKAFENLNRNFASGELADFSDEDLDTLSGGDVVEFDLQRGDQAYAFILPDEAQYNSTDGVSANVFALRPDSGSLEGRLVNNADYEHGIEQGVTVFDPTKIWRKSEIEERPHATGDFTKEKSAGETFELNSDKFKTENLDPKEIEEGDKVKLSSDGFALYVDGVSKDEISFERFSADPYKFDIVGEREREIEGYTHNFTTWKQLEEGDDIVIDGNETDINDWEDSKILVGIDEFIYNSDDPEVKVHDYAGGRSGVEIDLSDAYELSRKDRPGIWDVKQVDESYSLNTEARFEIESVGDDSFTGQRTVVDGTIVSKQDNGKSYQTGSNSHEMRVSYYLNDRLYEETIQPNQLISVREEKSVNPTFELRDSDPDVDWAVTNGTNGISKSELSDDDQVLLWDRVEEEHISGRVDRIRTSHVKVQVRDEYLDHISRRVEYYSGEIEDDSRFAIVGRAKDSEFGNTQPLPRNSEDQVELFYGQEVNFEYEGKIHTGYVENWDEKHIEITGSDVTDSIALKPTFDAVTNARLDSYQSWSDLSRSEKITQIEREWKFRINQEFISEEWVNKFSSKVSDEIVDSYKYIEDVREISARMGIQTQLSGAGGSISTRGSYNGNYKFTMNGVISYGGDVFEDDIVHSTFHHEFEHAFLFSKGFDNNSSTTSRAISFAGQYPDLDFNVDGSSNIDVNSNNNLNANYIGIEEYLFKKAKQNPKGELNDNDFYGIDLSTGFYETLNPQSIEDSKFKDSNIDLEKIFRNDDTSLANYNIKKGDIVIVDQKLPVKDDTKRIKGIVYEEIEEGDQDLSLVNVNTGDTLETAPKIYSVKKQYQVDEDEILDIDDPKIHVNDSWKPDSTDRTDKYAETANRSLKRRLWAASEDKNIRDLLEINRSYHTANSHESVTGLAEIFQAQNYGKAVQLVNAYKGHPEFVKAYLENHSPREAARKIILNDPEVSELESYL